MRHLYFVLTARCNELCRICPRSGSERIRDRETEETICKLKQDLETEAITDITVSGGEPSLHPGFAEVLRFLDGTGVRVTVLSNSLRFHDAAYAGRCFGSL